MSQTNGSYPVSLFISETSPTILLADMKKSKDKSKGSEPNAENTELVEVVEIVEENLPPDSRSLWLKAQSALEMGHHPYAIKLCHAVLEQYPGFIDARRLARSCAIAAIGGKKIKKSFFGGGGLAMMKITSLGKKDPVAGMMAVEKELAKDPFDDSANDVLYDCAMRLNMLNTAAYALENVRNNASANTVLLHKLAEHYLARDMPDKAADVYSDIVKRDSTDTDAVKGAKDSIARASMKKQNWEEAKGFRDVMKNPEEAAKLEASNRAAMTRDQIQEQLVVLTERYAADQNNLLLSKEIANLYEQLEDWSNAYAYYARAFELSAMDVALQTKANFMKSKAAEVELANIKLASDENPEDTELRTNYETMLKSRTEQQVIEARTAVERNPTDPQLRYELGLALYNAGNFSDAIPHLQQATRNPHIRTRVLLLLGKTFRSKGMHDLSIKQLSDALEDLHGMDGTKKEILYEKGLVHLDMNDKQAALNSFKQIYEVDYGYRDVAKRVEESYSM
jgi:tetratricopeptide (TPR) repeat protein